MPGEFEGCGLKVKRPPATGKKDWRNRCPDKPAFGKVKVHFCLGELVEVKSWVVRSDGVARAIAPAALREMVREEIAKMTRNCQTGAAPGGFPPTLHFHPTPLRADFDDDG